MFLIPKTRLTQKVKLVFSTIHIHTAIGQRDPIQLSPKEPPIADSIMVDDLTFRISRHSIEVHIVAVAMVMVVAMIMVIPIHSIHIYTGTFVGHDIRSGFHLGQVLHIILIDLRVIEALYFFYSYLRIWVYTAVLIMIFVLLVNPSQ